LAQFRAALSEKQARQERFQIARHSEAAGLVEHLLGESPGQNGGDFRTGLKPGFGVVRRISDHDRLRALNAELTQGHPDQARVGLSVLHVVAAAVAAMKSSAFTSAM